MRQSLANFLARGVVALGNAASKMQTLQLTLLAGEVKDGVEHLEPYGYTSAPHPGAEALVGFLGGDRSHGVVLVVADRRFRLQGLAPGEVALHTDEGDVFHFKRGRVIDLVTSTLNIKASTAVHFDTPLITTTGRVEAAGDVLAGEVSLLQHPHGGVLVGEGRTSAPIGGGA